MPLQRVPRLAFNRGKISRLGLGRVDVERAELTAETQTNWMPRVLGSMMLRPGWKYLGSTLSDTQAFLIPFIKSTDDTAFIEFTNESMRVWENDVLVERAEVSTTIRGGDFSEDITNFLKVDDPATTPGANSNGVAFSADGKLCAVAHDAASSRTLTVYSVNNTTLTILGTQPTGQDTAGVGQSVSFSPDGQFLAVTDQTTKGYRVWAITGTGASATFSAVTTSDLGLGIAFGCTFSPSSGLFAVAHNNSPYFTLFEISGSGVSATFTAIAAPSDLPTGIGDDVAFSPDGSMLAVAHVTSPYTTVYTVVGTSLTKIDDESSQFAATLPTGDGLSVEFSRDGNWMAVAHSTTPFVSIYSISGTAFTKVSNPGTLPDGGGRGCAFTSDNQFLAVAHSTSLFLSHYRLVAGVWTKQTDPATAPDGVGNAVAFSPNNQLMIVAHDTSAYLTAYQAYQWLDMDGSGASSTYPPAATWTTVLSRTLNTTLGAGFSGATIRQVLDPNIFGQNGSKIRIAFQAAAAGTFEIDKCYVGYQAGSGDAYDFASAPTQLTFNSGNSGFSISTGQQQLSDEVTFNSIDSGVYIISFHIVGTNDDAATVVASTSNQTIYYKLSVDEAASTNVSGYTDFTTRDLFGITSLEVLTSEASTETGLSFVGTNYNDARRTQSVSVLNADKAVVHGLRLTISQGEIDFHVGTEFGLDDLVTERKLGVGTYSFAFTPNANLFFIDLHSNTEYTSVLSSLQVDNVGDLTLPTPYETENLTEIRYAQSGDVIFLAAKGIKQQKILRFGAGSWGIADYLPADGPFRDENVAFITLTPSALTGDITVAASRDYFTVDNIGSLFRITSVGQTVEDDLNGANQFISHIKVTNTGTSRDITITRAGTWSATVTLQRSISEPGTWVDVATFTNNGTATYNDGLDNQTIYYRLGIKTGNYTSGTATLTLSYASGSIDGIIRVTAFTDRQNVSAIVLSPLGGTSAFETWAEGIWSNRRGWPSAVALYEGRLGWAGMDRIILSESDNYENFNDLEEGDAGPIIRTIGEGPVDDIHWLLPLQRLLAGAEGSEFSIRSNSFDEPLTPSNYNMKSCSTQGSAPVASIRIDSNGAFVERSGTRLYQLLYNFDTYDYASSDLTRLVPEMCEAGIKKIVLQRHPDTRIHCVLDDGTVAVCIFEPDEDVICWIDITTDGLIEDAVVLPQEALEDAVYYVVNRTIDGVTKRYIEKWALESECVGGTLNKNIDSFLEYSGASVTTITGLDHLEGEDVVVWGNGVDLGTYSVSSGQISGLSSAVTAAVIGLPYTAQYKSCKLAYAAQGGTALNARKILHSVGIIAADLHYQGLEYGDSFTYLRPLPSVYRHQDVMVDTIHTEYDDDLVPVNKEWGTDTRLCLQAESPRPCTLLAVTMVIETNA